MGRQTKKRIDMNDLYPLFTLGARQMLYRYPIVDQRDCKQDWQHLVRERERQVPKGNRTEHRTLKATLGPNKTSLCHVRV